MSNSLSQLSEAIASAIEQVGHSLVRVEARKRLPASGIVWSADGLVITGHHVVTRDENIRIGLPNGDVIPAALIGRDPTTDLALLKAETSGLTPSAQAAIDQIQVGHIVLATGRPGDSVQASMGIISALDEGYRTAAGGNIDRYIQSDIVMYPGFSGGALIDAEGAVIGLNSSALARGVNLTIPVETLKRVAGQLLEHGRVKRGFLGVSAQTVRLADKLGDELDQDSGLLITAVESDSPADKAGLVIGDTIVAFNHEKTLHMDHLLSILSDNNLVGIEVPVRIVRGGSLTEMAVTVGERS